MSKSEAIELAQGIARKEEWPWLEPVTVVLRREWIFSDGVAGLSIQAALIADETFA
jgi:hypothetical protein